jgi:hypothetical protein
LKWIQSDNSRRLRVESIQEFDRCKPVIARQKSMWLARCMASDDSAAAKPVRPAPEGN